MALTNEAPLDQIIRLQLDDEFARRNLRAPAQRRSVGVYVVDVQFDGKPYANKADLIGAAVSLQGRTPAFAGPLFESRNSIVGSDDTMTFVVNPFHLCISKHDAKHEVRIEARDILDPAHPELQLWQIVDPSVYARRLPTFQTDSAELIEAIGVYDYFGYFRDRRRFLHESIAHAEAAIAGDPAVRAAKELEIQAARSRIYQIEFWGDRFSTKLGFQCTWEFGINQPIQATGLAGRVDLSQAWPTTFWFGGWDGDLLTGFMRGSVRIPFLPTAKRQAVTPKR